MCIRDSGCSSRSFGGGGTLLLDRTRVLRGQAAKIVLDGARGRLSWTLAVDGNPVLTVLKAASVTLQRSLDDVMRNDVGRWRHTRTAITSGVSRFHWTVIFCCPAAQKTIPGINFIHRSGFTTSASPFELTSPPLLIFNMTVDYFLQVSYSFQPKISYTVLFVTDCVSREDKAICIVRLSVRFFHSTSWTGWPLNLRLCVCRLVLNVKVKIKVTQCVWAW